MLHLTIITPDQTVFEGEADSVSLPTQNGEITVLPHHLPIITTIAPGPVTARIGKEEHVFAVSRGIIEIDQKSVRVLSDIADRADDLEEAAIEKAHQQAAKVMAEKQDAEQFAEMTAVFERELARLRTVRRRRSHSSFTPPPA